MYQAEACLWGHGRTFGDAVEAAAYLDSIVTAEWFVKEYGWIPSITVQPCRRNNKFAGAASRNKHTIYLVEYTENVILHELSHLLVLSDEHCHLFANTFLLIIRHAMGFYAWAEFAYNLKENGFYDAD